MVLIRHGLGRCLLAAALCLASVSCATAPTPRPEPVPEAVRKEPPTPEATPAPIAAPAVRPVELRIAAVGDIMLGGTAAPELRKYGYDYPFDLTRDILKQAQIVFGNLEGPLTDGGAAGTAKQYVFRSPPDKVAPALARAGFNMVSLANNHTLDYGPEGLADTRAALEKAGIRHAGAGRNVTEARQPVYMMANGATVAFLAYSLTFPEEFWATNDRPGSPFGHESQVRADIAAAKQQADIVLVSFHWGQEGKIELRDYQKQLGRAAINAGAAAVIGHHPHVLQGVERYKHGVILYSLGNFTFGTYGPEAFRSVVAELTFREEWCRDAPTTEPRMHMKLAEVRLHPLNVRNAEVVFQPLPLAGAAAAKVVAELQQISRPLGTQLENRDGVAVLTLGVTQEARR